MNFRTQFMMAAVLCFASSTFGASADQVTCDVSLEAAPANTPIPPTWPVQALPGYICGVKNKSNSIDYHQCQTCTSTAMGQKCQLIPDANAPTVASEQCKTYGPVNIIDITKNQKYHCENSADYTCLQISSPSACDKCVAYTK